jgi:hypothetical protein
MLDALLMCSDPLEPRKPDSAFAADAEAGRQAGLGILLVDHDAVERDDPRNALRRVQKVDGRVKAAYRGWMLRPGEYARLHGWLSERGIDLLVDPAAYTACR